jgi:hypothetical protein
MKYSFLIPFAAPLLASVFSVGGHAQERMYRCDNNYYTNSNATTDPKARGCKLVEGGNVTIVQGTRPAGAGVLPVKVAAASQAQAAPRAESGDQRARDSDARQILESELKRAEARQAELNREYNNGEPDKQGGEARNYQKYIDRVAELKASLARNESDIAGIRRELGRAGGASSAAGASGAK